MSHWVYALAGVREVKIGISKDILTRRKQLQGADPLDILAAVEFPDEPSAKEYETSLHNALGLIPDARCVRADGSRERYHDLPQVRAIVETMRSSATARKVDMGTLFAMNLPRVKISFEEHPEGGDHVLTFKRPVLEAAGIDPTTDRVSLTRNAEREILVAKSSDDDRYTYGFHFAGRARDLAVRQWLAKELNEARINVRRQIPGYKYPEFVLFYNPLVPRPGHLILSETVNDATLGF